MAGEYPKREAFYAHKLVRLMIRVCAAQEIGCDGVWLVTVVAHTEDAKHYSAPVTWWNDQLMSVAGFSLGQLVRARRKAVECGWLHHEPGGKGKVGRYWTLIPRAYASMPDGAVDCDASILVKNDQDDHILIKNATESAREAQEKRRTNARHSSLSLSLPSELNCTELNCAEPGSERSTKPEPSPEPKATEIPPLPIGRVNPSAVYRSLSEKHLASARSMVEWFRRQLSASKPVLPATRESLLLVLCSAARASEPGVQNRVGKFVRLVQEARWDEVDRYRAEAAAALDGPLRSTVSASTERVAKEVAS